MKKNSNSTNTINKQQSVMSRVVSHICFSLRLGLNGTLGIRSKTCQRMMPKKNTLRYWERIGKKRMPKHWKIIKRRKRAANYYTSEIANHDAFCEKLFLHFTTLCFRLFIQ